jgi:hypothetical protein
MTLYRSLKFKRLPDESLFRFLERLAEEGYLQNNRQLIVTFDCSCSSRFVELIFSMKNLEKLNLFDSDLTLEVLAHAFQSCSKLIDVNIMSTYGILQMPEHLKNQLRPSLQRLRYFDFRCSIDNDSWPVILEMLT